MTITEVAGNSIANASRVAYRQPKSIEVLFAFSLATGLLLQRGRRAARTSDAEWAMDRATIDSIWPDIEHGLRSYLNSADDFGSYVPSKDEFFQEVVPDSLAMSRDARLAVFPRPAVILEVLSERWGENWQNLDASEQNFMLTLAQGLFAALK